MKEDRDTIDRRQFTLGALLAMLAGATITITGCGDDEPTTPTPAAETATIAGNHGHDATITSAQLVAGNGLELHIQNTASHDHTVTLSSAEIVQIRDQQMVAKQSSTANGHNHLVTFNG
jgi:hypothetical protein